MDKEFEFIISAIKGDIIKTENLDFNWILGFLELHKISGYFYNQCKKLDVALPHNVDRKLNQIMRLQSKRNELLRKYISLVRDALNNAKVNYVFLKGSVLSNCNIKLSELAFKCMHLSAEEEQKYASQRLNTFYDNGERISNDIDILINPKDITVASEALKKLGFKQGYYDFNKNSFVELSRREILSRRMNRGETAPFILTIDNELVPFIEVDINFSLSALPTGDEKTISKMLNDKICYAGTIAGGINGLSGMDFFMHLVNHQYKESVLKFMVDRNKDLDLYKLLDMYIFIKEGYIDLSAVVTYAKLNKMEKETYYVLCLMNCIFNDIGAIWAITSLGVSDSIFLNEVYDIPNSKKYYWAISFADRIIRPNRLDYLLEVQDD